MRAIVLGQKCITPFPKTKECEQIRLSETTLTTHQGLWWEAAGARGDQTDTPPFYYQNHIFGGRNKQHLKILTHRNRLYWIPFAKRITARFWSLPHQSNHIHAINAVIRFILTPPNGENTCQRNEREGARHHLSRPSPAQVSNSFMTSKGSERVENS